MKASKSGSSWWNWVSVTLANAGNRSRGGPACHSDLQIQFPWKENCWPIPPWRSGSKGILLQAQLPTYQFPALPNWRWWKTSATNNKRQGSSPHPLPSFPRLLNSELGNCTCRGIYREMKDWGCAFAKMLKASVWTKYEPGAKSKALDIQRAACVSWKAGGGAQPAVIIITIVLLEFRKAYWDKLALRVSLFRTQKPSS